LIAKRPVRTKPYTQIIVSYYVGLHLNIASNPNILKTFASHAVTKDTIVERKKNEKHPNQYRKNHYSKLYDIVILQHDSGHHNENSTSINFLTRK
jgi:hypothetical protein